MPPRMWRQQSDNNCRHRSRSVGTMGGMPLNPVAQQRQRSAVVAPRHSGASSAQARLAEYLEWTTNALEHPRRRISLANLTCSC
jgi:hypothetical protein